MNKITTYDYCLSDVFKNFYVVPDYQREYVWKTDNVSELLADIFQQFSDNFESEYFIGSIVVCKNRDGQFEVIDGQQRLTTLFACLCAFKNTLGSNKTIEDMLFSSKIDISGKETSEHRLQLQYEEASDIVKRITIDNTAKDALSNSSVKIIDAYVTGKIFINNIKDQDAKRRFLGYFTNKVKLVQIETTSVSEALKIFETINARGVGLSPMDLLKNLIFSRVSKQEYYRLKNDWHIITKVLEEKPEEKPLRFLRYFLMANYNVKNERSEEIIREDEIYKLIIKPSNKEQIGYDKQPFEFINSMQLNAEFYKLMLKGQNKDGTLNVFLDNINKLGGGSFRQHLIILLAAKNLDKELFNHLAGQIEVLIYYYLVTGVPARELERNFSKWAKRVKNIKTKNDLNNFIKEELQKEIDQLKIIYENAFLEISTNSMQDYRIRYILAKISEYIDNCYIGSNEHKTLDYYIRTGIELEHILPKSPDEALLSSFGEDYDNYKAKLGNLTFLEKPRNVVASNDYYLLKKPLYENSKFSLTKSLVNLKPVGKDTSINRVNEHLRLFEIWSKVSIDDRQKMLLELSKLIWQIRLIE
jgi:uncharacterized protein with ParB-like and HNH nuclease domain